MLKRREDIIEDEMINKLFIDAGVGNINSEAWGRKKDFTIIGFEPCVDIYNNLKDVYPGKLLNIVVLDKDGEIDCWESSKYGVWLFRDDDMNGEFKKVNKKTIKLDSLEWRNFDEIHIWADIEGSELLMLKGATEMLSSGKVKWINLEVREDIPFRGWCTTSQVCEFLDKRGFKPTNFLIKKRHRDVIFIPKDK